MDKREFYNSVPYFLELRAHGRAELKIEEKVSTKTVCYRDKEGASSFSQSAESWLELYSKLMAELKEHNYLK